jgi:mucin-2
MIVICQFIALMGINTFTAKKIHAFFLFTLLFGAFGAVAQCPTVVDNTQSFCDLQSPTISSLVATNNGGGVVWYANATGGPALSGTSGLVNGEDYWADGSGCGVRQQVVVTIYSAPVGLSFQGVCVGVAGDAQINDLQATGNNVQWYTSPSGGTPLPSTAQLVDGTIYYASQTNPDTGCESSRLSVFVNVGVVPTPTGAPIQTFCSTASPTIANLVASGVNNWYPTSTSAVQLAGSTPLVNGQSYFATTVDPPCESQSRLEVVVQILPPNNAGTNGIRNICVNQVSTTAPFNLFGLLGGTPQAAGVWTGPIATTNGSLGTLNPSTMTLAGSPYVFTYTVNNGACTPASSTVTITILPMPTASISGNTTICANGNATVTFTGTPNATVTYTVSGTPGNQTIVLNGSGTATLVGPYTATTTITLVSVASSGTPSCSQTISGSVVINVLPLPTASIASNVSICSGGSATVTFTGTPNATVTYNTGGGNQTIVLNGSGTATVTATYTTTTTFNLVSVVSATTPACTRAVTGSVTVTVIQPPTVTIGTNASVCPNGSATVTFTGTPNGTVTYTVTGTPGNQTILLNGSGTATITTTYTATTTYTLVSVATGGTPVCTSPASGSVTITVLALPTVAISANATICSGGSATVTFTGTPNATVTYTVTGTPGNQTVVLNALGTATITGTYTANTTFTLVSVASAGTPSCSQPATGSVTITVIPPPTVTIASNATICSGGTATVTFTGTPNSTVTYTVTGTPGNQTIVLNALGTASITGTFTSTTTYTLVSIATSGTPVCTRPVTGTITITVVPPPTVAISANATICSGGTATVTFTGTPNATVTYTVTGTPGNQTIVLNGSGTATITGTYTSTTVFTLVSVVTSGTPSCTQPAVGTVTITVIPPPTVTIASNATICSGGTATVTFTGTPNATVTYTVTGTPGNQTIVLNALGTATITGTFTSTTTYTLVSIATSGTPVCTRPVTGTITITVVPPPTVAISANATICSGGTATVTFTGTPNATVTYTVTGTPGNQTIVLNASGTATITGTYTSTTAFTLVSIATSGTPSCSQPAAGTITITVIPPPTVTIASSTTVCSGGAATVTFTGTPNATVTYTVTGTPGNQTIVLNGAGTATITGTYTSTTTYTLISVATTGTPSCSQPATGTITITVTPPPTASIAASATVCPGGSATVTFTGTPNATITYTVTGTPGNQTIILNALGTAAITGTYTSTTTYTLVSVATTGSPGCTAPATGTITITVLPPPTVSISANATICLGGTATVTFTGTPNATVTYTVTGTPGNQTIVLNASGTATITGTYTSTTTFTLVSIATSGTPSCTAPAAGSITITVVPPPTVTISANATVCTGGSATVTFTGAPNATVTYTVTGTPGNQTIVLNALGTATITGTFTTTTTYTLVSVATSGTPSCSAPATGTITITVVPPPTVTISANATVCSGGTATVTFTGTPNATVTYTVTGTPGNQTIVLNAVGTATINGTFTATTTYTLVSVATTGTPGCSVPATGTITITVVPPPVVAISSSTTICSGGSATVTFTGTPNATIAYTVTGTPGNQTIVLNGLGTAAITGTYTSTTTYTLVSATTSGTPACSVPAAGTITITVTPPPTVVISTNATVCTGGSATVTFTGTPNATVTYTVPGTPGNQTIVLNGLGTATITGVYTSTTTYTLVSVATSGTPSCTAPATGTITITVLPPPTVSITANATICSGASATVTFTGTPNATVTYNTGGPNQTIVLDASGTATITNTYTTTTTFTLVSVTSAGTPSCTQPAAGSVIITVIQPPTVTISASSTSVCSGSSATVTFTGTPNATVTYTVTGTPGNQTIVLDGSGTATVTGSVSGTITYTLVSVATTGTPSCSQPATGTVTITVTPPPVAGNDVADLQLCATGPPVDLFTLLGPTAQPDGTWSPALASGTGVFNPAVDVTGTYTYSVPGTGPCPNDTATVNVTIIPAPNAGADAMINLCTTLPAQDLFLLLGASAQAGGTWSPALPSGTGVFDPEVDSGGIYTYTVTGVLPCGNDTATVEVSITQGSDAGQDASVTFCSNEPPQDLFNSLGGTPMTGGTWTPPLASGTGVFNPAVDAAEAYTYTTLSNACPDDTATVTVTVTAPSNAGNDATLPICSNADAQDLFTLLGPAAQVGGTWSPALASGTGVFNPAVDASGSYTYTVNGTPACGNDSATVTVDVTQGPDAGQNGTLTLCVDSTSQDLFNSLGGTPMVGGTWSPALASGTGVFDPAVDAAGAYTYTFIGNAPCANDSATVTVTVNPVPNAGTDGTAFFCSNHAPADLIASLGGTPQPGGSWSPALASGTGVFNPAVDPAGTYTYTVGGGFCSTSTASVTVSVTQAPNAGGLGATLQITACTTVTSVDLFTALSGTQDAGGIWTNDNNDTVGNIIDPSALGQGTYHFTYTVTGGTSPCISDSATVTVTVVPIANAGTFVAAQPVCSSAVTFDLMTLLNGAQTGGVWTDAANASVTNPIDITGFGPGPQSFTYTVTNACGTDFETVQLTVLANPTLTTQNITLTSPICIGNDAILTFNGLTDGNYTLTYDLTGANNAPGQSANVNVTGGTANFIIPSATLTNIGTTTVTFTTMLNTISNCLSTLTNVQADVVVQAIANLEDANLSVVNFCLGQSMTIVIAGATGMPDGNYTFNYSIPNAAPAIGSVDGTITAGSGQLTLSAALFTTANNYTVTITGIVSQSGGCSNNNENASMNFQVFAVPSAAGATVSAANTCIGVQNMVNITGATNLPDGDYTITYALSGANTITNTVTVTFTGGNASFIIPASELANSGSTTLTIQSITTTSSPCAGSGADFNAVTFNVVQLGTPVLIPLGNEFCAADQPTIAQLSANITGSDPVTWYNAATGGTAYAPTDLLQNGVTYYATYIAGSGCESPARLAVTVDLTACDDIAIPDGFSPNDDGINDDFVIINLPELYPRFTLEIYNRYGNVLYKGNINTPNWNGTASQGGLKIGGDLPVGVYFFILNFNDGNRQPIQGRVYLSR